MQVTCKKMSGKCCFLCKDHGKITPAVGFCIQCDDFICHKCFESHKKWKVAKDHTLESNGYETKGKYSHSDEFDVCDKHDSKKIKFYCPSHMFVGCGDCMVLGHKPCRVEYIRDKAKVFKDGQDFKRLVEGITESLEEVKLIESSAKLNKTQIKDINDKFIADVKIFKDEIIAKVKKQSDEMIEKAEMIQVENMNNMDVLEEECGRVSKDLSSMTQVLDILTDKPNKLFVKSLQLKKTTTDIRNQLVEMKRRNVIEKYHFVRGGQIECAKLGNLHKEESLVQKKPEDAYQDDHIYQKSRITKPSVYNSRKRKEKQERKARYLIDRKDKEKQDKREYSCEEEPIYQEADVTSPSVYKDFSALKFQQEYTTCDVCSMALTPDFDQYEQPVLVYGVSCRKCSSRFHRECIARSRCPNCSSYCEDYDTQYM